MIALNTKSLSGRHFSPASGEGETGSEAEEPAKGAQLCQERSPGPAAPGVTAATSAGQGGRRMQEARLVQRRPNGCSWRSHLCLGQPEPLSSFPCSASMCHSDQGSYDNGSHCSKGQCPSWAAQESQVGPSPQAGWQLQLRFRQRSPDSRTHMSLCTCAWNALECISIHHHS